MKTDKFISNISYNTPVFLKSRLDELIATKTIAFYCFIAHKGEIDPYEPEIRDKDHIHLLVKPQNAIDTDTLTDFLTEYQEGETLPLGVTNIWKKSKEGDFIMYSAHFKPYLDSKGETKEFYNYPWSDFVTSDDSLFRRFRASAKVEYKANYTSVKTLVEQGASLNQIFDSVNPSAIQSKAVSDIAHTVAELIGTEFVQVDKKTGETVRTDIAQ